MVLTESFGEDGITASMKHQQLIDSIIKQASTSNTTEPSLCAWHSKSWPKWPMTTAMEEKKVGEEKRRNCIPVSQVLTWLAWRGSAHAANQARPGEDFTGGGNGGTGSNPT
jgi:hypothetical protein